MDSLIAAAARALAAGDPLGALARVALRRDPPALALRGIAMAQLGELARARDLLRRAERGFRASHEEVARARCVVAGAEVALAMRDLRGSTRTLTDAAAALATHADHANADQARLVLARRLVLLGRLEDAETTLHRIDAHHLPPSVTAVVELTTAELALRRLHVARARGALERAGQAAAASGVPALQAEVAEAQAAIERPVARHVVAGHATSLRVDDVVDLLDSGALVLDGCRRGLQRRGVWVPLARRPVLFELARVLAESSPVDVDRGTLIARVFHTRRPDETHRARLRVEIGRLRTLVADMARVDASARGYVLVPRDGAGLVVMSPPIDGDDATLRALLADGAAWSTSALALALGTSQRSVQRSLQELETAGRVRSIGQARARRWLAPPLTGFATTLLLTTAVPPA